MHTSLSFFPKKAPLTGLAGGAAPAKQRRWRAREGGDGNEVSRGRVDAVGAERRRV